MADNMDCNDTEFGQSNEKQIIGLIIILCCMHDKWSASELYWTY